MRRELEELALLDQYIDGLLSVSEKKDFENRLRKEPNFKQALEDQIALRKGIERKGLKEEIHAKGKGRFGKRWFWVFTLPLLLIIYYLIGNKSEYVQDKKVHKTEQLQPILNETVIDSKSLKGLDTNNLPERSLKPQTNIPRKKVNDSSNQSPIKTEGQLVQFDVEEQMFWIDNSTSSQITGKDGVILTFKPNSFEGGDSIEIRLKEYYKYSDIVMRGLSTTSNGKHIETGGMINIQAYSNGEKTTLKPKQSYEIAFPKRAGNNIDGKTFYADSEDNLNWKIDTNELIQQPCRTIRKGQNLIEISGLPGPGSLKGFKPAQKYLMRFAFTSEQAMIFVNAEKYPTARVTVKIVKGKVSELKIDSKDRNFKTILLAYMKEFDKEEIKARGLSYITDIWFEDPAGCGNIKQKFSKIDQKTADQLNQTLRVSEYNIIESLNLGLVNCDAFANINRKLIDLNYMTSVDCKLMLMFKERDVFLSNYGFAYKERLFTQIPADEEIILVAYRESEESDFEVCIQEYKTNRTNNNLTLAHFSKMTTDQFSRTIDSIKD